MRGIKAAEGEQPDSDLREIRFLKNNYGRLAETIVVRWRDGMFRLQPGESSLEKVAKEAKAEEVFISLLHRFAGSGRNVSELRGANYAPLLFAREPEARAAKLTQSDLDAAMRRLFAAKKITVTTYRRSGHDAYRIVGCHE
jgi:hypothetical protein